MGQHHRGGHNQAGSLRPGLRDRSPWSIILLLLLTCTVVLGCRSDPTPASDPSPEPTTTAPAEQTAEIPAADPCVVSSIEVRAEGGGDRIPEALVRGLLEDGLLAHKVPQAEGAAGSLRVVYLLTQLEGDAAWSLGLKALWEVMDGPLRVPVSVDIVQDLAEDADLTAAAKETVERLSATLVFRCRLGTVPSEALPRLDEGLSVPEDLVAWARACGDRKVEACGPGLSQLLVDERARVAAAAALALGQAGIVSAVPAMVERTIRAEPLVVRAVVLALGELGTEEARRYLRLWSDGHPDPEVKELAAEMMDLK